MTPKKRKKATSRLARWLCTLSIAALAIVIFLPTIMNWQVNKILQGLMTNGVAEFRLLHVGLYRSDLSITFFENPARESIPVQVDSCKLEYRPLQLLAGHIDSVRINGVSLLAVATNGTFRIPAAELFAKDTEDNAEPLPKFSLQSLQQSPISVGLISLQGHLVLDLGAERTLVPINLLASSTGSNHWKNIAAHIDATVAASKISLDASCDTRAEAITTQLNGVLSTDSLPYSIRRNLPESLRRISGDFKSTTTLNLNGTSLKAIDLTATANVAIETPDGIFDLHPELKVAQAFLPVSDLKATDDGTRIEASLTGLKATLAGITVSLDATNLVCNIPEQTFTGNIRLGIDTNAPLVATFKLDPHSLQAKLTEDAKLWHGTLNVGDFTVTCDGARLDATGNSGSESTTPSFVSNFGFDRLAVNDAGGERIALIENGVDGRVTLEKIGEHLTGGATFKFDDAAIPQSQLNIRKTCLNFTADSRPESPLSVFAEASADAAFRGIDIAKLNATLSQPSNDLFSVKGTVKAFSVEGTFGSIINLAAEDGTTISNTFELAEQSLDLSLLPQLVPELEGFTIGGKVFAAANYHLNPKSQRGSFKFRFSEGTLSNPEQKLSASDIQMTFEMPYLPSLASNSQLFSFKNLKVGNFNIDSGLAIFRMQSPIVWYLDKLILDWCGGKVRGESTRITRTNQKIWLTLHADQLTLAGLLQQFGIGTDTGESGKLSGTIPIVISDGKITIKDGYFHSAPGKSGTVQLLPSKLIASTAAATIETSLALDALSEFTYAWIRLVLNSEGEDLLIKFEMDGKPSHKLFYSIKGGEIVKSKNPSEFKGIVLDTNFRIPLNKLISLSKPLATIMKDSTVE